MYCQWLLAGVLVLVLCVSFCVVLWLVLFFRFNCATTTHNHTRAVDQPQGEAGKNVLSADSLEELTKLALRKAVH